MRIALYIVACASVLLIAWAGSAFFASREDQSAVEGSLGDATSTGAVTGAQGRGGTGTPVPSDGEGVTAPDRPAVKDDHVDEGPMCPAGTEAGDSIDLSAELELVPLNPKACAAFPVSQEFLENTLLAPLQQRGVLSATEYAIVDQLSESGGRRLLYVGGSPSTAVPYELRLCQRALVQCLPINEAVDQ